MVFKFFEQISKREHRCRRQHYLSDQLGIGKPIEREQLVQYEERRDLQHDLSHESEQLRFFAHAARLEYAYGKKVHCKEGLGERKTLDEP